MVSTLTLEKLGWEVSPLTHNGNTCEFTITQHPILADDYYTLFYLLNTDRPKAGIGKKADDNILQVNVGNKVLKENDFKFSSFILEEFLITEAKKEKDVVTAQDNRDSLHQKNAYYFNGYIGRDVVFDIKDKECHYDSIDTLQLAPGEKTFGVFLNKHTLICPVMKYDFNNYQIWFKGQIFENIDKDMIIYTDNDYEIYIREIDNRLMLKRTTYTGLVEEFMIYSHILQKGDVLNVCLQEFGYMIKVIVNGVVLEVNNLMVLAKRTKVINQKSVSYSNIKTHINHKAYTSKCHRCLANDYKISFERTSQELDPVDVVVSINRNYWLRVIEQEVEFINNEKKVLKELKYAI